MIYYNRKSIVRIHVDIHSFLDHLNLLPYTIKGFAKDIISSTARKNLMVIRIYSTLINLAKQYRIKTIKQEGKKNE